MDNLFPLFLRNRSSQVFPVTLKRRDDVTFLFLAAQLVAAEMLAPLANAVERIARIFGSHHKSPASQEFKRAATQFTADAKDLLSKG